MGASAHIVTSSPVPVQVSPGETAEVELRVRNTGDVVDQFTFQVVGAAASWVRVEPAALDLFPTSAAAGSSEATVKVIFAPPTNPAPAAGEVAYGIRVVSKEDPDGSTVEEGTVVVSEFADISAELLPRTSRGRRHGIHELAIDNRGNIAVRVRLSTVDPNNLLAIDLDPAELNVPPGSAVFAKVRVRPEKRFWKGAAKTHPFQLVVEHEHAAPLALDGSFVQLPILPAWTSKAVAALIALILLAVALWFTVLKPQIRSTATQEVHKQLAAAGVVAPTNSGGAKPPSGGGGGATGGGSTPTTTTEAPGSGNASFQIGGQPVGQRLTISGNGTTPYVVPTGHVLQLTDLVLENPNGDTGTLTIARNGQPLLVLSMANFRDLDYHWVSPIIFGSGQQLQLTTSGCTGPCSPGAYFSGYLPKSA